MRIISVKLLFLKTMKHFIFLLLFCVLFSCKLNNKRDLYNLKNTLQSDSLNAEKQVEQEKTHKKFLTKEIKKKLLGGIWVTKAYDYLLNLSNSLLFSQKNLQTYSDIIFDGDSIMYCSYPFLEEEHQLKIFNDLSVRGTIDSTSFNILKLDNDTMVIRGKENKTFKYYKIKNDIKSLEVSKGSIVQEKKWFSGDYKLMVHDKVYNFKVDKSGKLLGEMPFKKIKIYTWYEEEDKKEYEIISFWSENYEESYLVELATNNTFYLQKINKLEDAGQTIIRQELKAYLKKESQDYNSHSSDSKAILLDSLVDINGTNNSFSEIKLYIENNFESNENGVYNLDSLKKVYQEKLHKSNVLELKEFKISETETKNYEYDNEKYIDINNKYYILGSLKNLTDECILMPHNGIYLITVSNKNEVIEKLICKDFLTNDKILAKGWELYGEYSVPFINGEQVNFLQQINNKTIFTPLFNDRLKENESYICFFKLETHEGNSFYSSDDIEIIKYSGKYEDKYLQKIEDNIYQFKEFGHEVKEYVFKNNEKKQTLQFLLLSDGGGDTKGLFKLHIIDANNCESSFVGKANSIFFDESEYFVENKSMIKKIVFSKDRKKAKILIREDSTTNCAKPLEEVLELIK